VEAAFIASTALLGLAGMPHCAAMCGAPCAAAGGAGRASWPFHAARIAGYAAAGAVAAGSVSTLALLSEHSAALRPLWTLLHAAALALGVHLLWRGRQPAWLARMGRVPVPAGGSTGAGGGHAGSARPGNAGGPDARGLVATGASAATAALAAPRPGLRGAGPRGPWGGAPTRRIALGLAWVAWPCGLLQSALMVAALAGGPAAGAAAMAAFAGASMPALVAAPWLLQRLRAARAEALAVRAAGALLVAGSGWALGHGLWRQVALWCA
jgi:sulfite exporter TauE/SafE